MFLENLGLQGALELLNEVLIQHFGNFKENFILAKIVKRGIVGELELVLECFKVTGVNRAHFKLGVGARKDRGGAISRNILGPKIQIFCLVPRQCIPIEDLSHHYELDNVGLGLDSLFYHELKPVSFAINKFLVVFDLVIFLFLQNFWVVFELNQFL